MKRNASTVTLLRLTLCGPSDVAREMEIAREVINDWNCQHGEQRGFWVKHQHWSTDSYPDAQATAQGAINKQLIDADRKRIGYYLNPTVLFAASNPVII
jgi:hypothetical protein